MLLRDKIKNGEEEVVDRLGLPKPASCKLASFALFAIVILAPLPFGSVDPLPIVTWCTMLGMALCTASLRGLDRRHLLIVTGLAVVVGAYLLAVHEQVAARPFFDAAPPDSIWRARAGSFTVVAYASTSCTPIATASCVSAS